VYVGKNINGKDDKKKMVRMAMTRDQISLYPWLMCALFKLFLMKIGYIYLQDSHLGGLHPPHTPKIRGF